MVVSSARFTNNEEIANAISHGLGFIFTIVASFYLVKVSYLYGNIWNILSNSIFGVSMMLLYLSSTLNHSLPLGKTKNFFHNFDQIAIYFLIAGTYTPLALTVIRNNGGWLMFGAQWTIAAIGLLIKLFLPNKFERGVHSFTIISYILMGWMLLFFLSPLIHSLPIENLVLIFLGGFSYTFGVIFFKIKSIRYSHLIWHIMVMLGTCCHWTALYLYVLPAKI